MKRDPAAFDAKFEELLLEVLGVGSGWSERRSFGLILEMSGAPKLGPG
jgi:hypothetical protein